MIARLFSANPVKISWTLPRVFSTAVTPAHKAPPAIAARISRVISSGAGASRRKATQLAAIAPMMICPSTPIFHRPAVNVTSNPEELNNSGIKNARTCNTFDLSPNEPSTMDSNAVFGLVLNRIKIKKVTNKASRTGTTGQVNLTHVRNFTPDLQSNDLIRLLMFSVHPPHETLHRQKIQLSGHCAR